LTPAEIWEDQTTPMTAIASYQRYDLQGILALVGEDAARILPWVTCFATDALCRQIGEARELGPILGKAFCCSRFA
jgi:hypothetical protein